MDFPFCDGLKRRQSIERDIARMFGAENFDDIQRVSASRKVNHEDIAAVLSAFCNCRSQISYVQFMSHLVEILLHFQSPRIAFISLCNMVNAEIFEIYIHCNAAEIRQRIEVFAKMLVFNASDIARHLQRMEI